MYGDVFGIDDKNNYYTQIGYSIFTMLQIMTLDGWGEIGRQILYKWNMVSALFLCFFILVMSYFFWNILIGFILEILRDQKKEMQQQMKQSKGQDKKKKLSTDFPLLPTEEAPKFDYVIGVLQALCIINSFFQPDLVQIKGGFSICIHFVSSVAYTIHYFYQKKKQSEDFIQRRKSRWIEFFDIVSGPLALIFDIISLQNGLYISHGGYLKIGKIFTIKILKGIILGAIRVFPLLMPPFSAIMGIIFILSMWSQMYLNQVSKYWTNFNNSVYTFFQILTLDDWCAHLIKVLLKNQHKEGPFIFIGFIFVANFFFLNIMIAISCEKFQEVGDLEADQDVSFYRKQNETKLQKQNRKANENFENFCAELLSLKKISHQKKEQISQYIEDSNNQLIENYNSEEIKFVQKYLNEKYQEQKEETTSKNLLVQIQFENQNININLKDLLINSDCFSQVTKTKE